MPPTGVASTAEPTFRHKTLGPTSSRGHRGLEVMAVRGARRGCQFFVGALLRWVVKFGTAAYNTVLYVGVLSLLRA